MGGSIKMGDLATFTKILVKKSKKGPKYCVLRHFFQKLHTMKLNRLKILKWGGPNKKFLGRKNPKNIKMGAYTRHMRIHNENLDT